MKPNNNLLIVNFSSGDNLFSLRHCDEIISHTGKSPFTVESWCVKCVHQEHTMINTADKVLTPVERVLAPTDASA